MSGHANTGGITKSHERPGRGCDCCPNYASSQRRKRERQVARRTAKQELRNRY